MASGALLEGRYELRERIGEGGMGVVYRARDMVFGRDVALKLLKSELPHDSPAATRFRVEATITGQLQHPGIPPAYELGTLSDGQPFLAMKLVEGQTLRQLLQERQMPAEGLGRLIAIFEQICHAVGYAHAVGVLHRDLKPGNIMVGAHGEVQVMDWGLARVLQTTSGADRQPSDQSDPDATVAMLVEISTPQPGGLETRTGSVLGTPSYMAPEQAAGEIRKLDARADVFGLGAVLCEILTGAPPYRSREDHDVRVQAVRWEMAEAFGRLDSCGAEPELVALCKRCLAFRKEDRPADGTAVARQVAQIREAAEARARQAELEQQRALVREAESRKRWRLMLWSSLAIAAVLFAGLGASLWQMQRAIRAERLARANAEAAQRAEAMANQHAAQALRERDAKAAALQAEEAARQLAEQRRQEAETNLGYAQKANEILGSVFSGLDPNAEYQTIAELRNALGNNLRSAVEQLQGSAIGDPLVVANMQHTLGLSLLGLGDHQSAATLFERALATRQASLGPDHRDTLLSMDGLAAAYQAAGRLAESLTLHEVTLRRLRNNLGPDHPDTLASINNLAGAYQAAGRLADALPLYEETLARLRARLGPEHPDTLASMNNLASGYRAAGRLAEAVALFEETLALCKSRLGPDHPDTLTTMNNLARTYQVSGRLAEALPLLEEALALRRARLGPDHPDTLISMNNLASAYQAAGRLQEALPLYEETLALFKSRLGPDHPNTLTSMNNLAGAYQAAGQVDQAQRLFEEVVALCKVKLGPDHPDTLTSMSNLAHGYEAAGRLAEALPLYEETLARRRAKLGPDHPNTLTSMNNLAGAYLATGRLEEALSLYEQTLALRKARLGPEHPDTLTSMNNLALAYRAASRLDLALPLLEEAASGIERRRFVHQHAGRVIASTIAAWEAARQFDRAEVWRRKWMAYVKEKAGDDSSAYVGELAGLGLNLLQQKKWTEAEAVLRECLAIRRQQQPEAWTMFNTQSMLGEALLQQEKYAEAEPLLVSGYEGLKAHLSEIPQPVRTERLVEAIDRLIALYTALNRPDDVQTWQAEKARLSVR